MIGKKLEQYEVTKRLGEGGMGVVYEATDMRLERSVALKVLPEAFATDFDRVARFEREAKLLASLNHPNIAAIYGLEKSGGAHFLVLELVEGETIAERLRRGPIPVAEALHIALRIAEAMEWAHEKGVIHRDLKPANIKIDPDGKVKVLDFGLAKVFATEPIEANVSQSPTLSMAATNAGVILGTAAYMSPEQAKGRVVDKRSDIFSFGCVLYEMLTAHQAFEGETVTEVLAWILAREADFGRLPANLNPKITDLIRRCLEKDLKKRWQAVGDLRVEIESILADPRGLEAQAPLVERKLPVWKIAAIALASALVGVAIGGGVIWNLRSPAPAKIARFSAVLPDDQAFTRTGRSVVAISPDGANMVYTIWIYDLSGATSLRRMTFEGANGYPMWSPDGKRVAFRSKPRDGKLGIFVQAADGSGVAERLTTAESGDHRPESWSPDGKTLLILASDGKVPTYGLWTVPLAGERRPEVFYDLPASQQGHADFSPDGHWVAYNSEESGKRQIYVQPFPKTGAKYQISREGADLPVWSPDGKELFYYRLDTNKLVSVRIQTQPSFSFTSPVDAPLINRLVVNQGGGPANYDFTPGGKRLLVLLQGSVNQSQPRATQEIHIVLNWLDELKRRVPLR